MKIWDKLRTRAAERLAELEDQMGDADKNVKPVTTANPISRLYIDTLKNSLLNELYIENEVRIVQSLRHLFYKTEATYQNIYNVDPALQFVIHDYKQDGRSTGMHRKEADGSYTAVFELRNYLELAHTMIGRKRLDNIQYCIEEVIKSKIPGDVIETGIWRGGATIFMRGVFAAYGITDRRVWAADSFQGVPPPTLPEDAGWDLSEKHYPVLTVKIEEVQQLFARYGLLDEQVCFLQGWFKDTLAKAPIKKLAVLRLDGDLYESTMDALKPLYPKVASGGFIIVDDYTSIPPCARAINEFRAAHGITDPIQKIDDQGVFWRKS
jgi:O-methyltransferase